ncbi:ABC transporter substrate-binding protein [Bifidobacterium aemilianum]|uniref:ABC transporter substrate-binding protein n=1 Tax=Bifidobacterium aemilianum TaxID=2493120 RepID=A0A366K946_9BIFI|nr:ABC transporter substrate-binding protein [Bifidobacterium aemilianum]RBP97688.1 ABC transporter substrate-binding protein [Bifidobacterium aemilianum]
MSGSHAAGHKRSGLGTWLVFLLIAALLTLLLLLGWSVGTGHLSTLLAPGKEGKSLRVGVRSIPTSLDIRKEQDKSVEQILLGNVYETLVSRDEQNQLKPGLAKEWKVSDDGLTYQFTMRNGLHFSNGHSLTAEEAVSSLKATVEGQYLGASELEGLAKVSNSDDQHLTISLSRPRPGLLRALSGRTGIVYDKANSDYGKTAVGSGPFTVSDFSAGQTIGMAKNTSYWGKQASIDKLAFLHYTDNAAMSKALKEGKIQLAIPQAREMNDKLFTGTGLQVRSGQTTEKVLLAYNSGSNSIYADEHMRQGTRHLLDTASIASSQPDAAGPLGGPISPLEPGYEDLTGLFPFDKDKGRRLLSYFSSRYIGTLDLLVPQPYQSLGETISQQLQDNGGLSVKMEVLSQEAVEQRMADGLYTLALMTMDQPEDTDIFAGDSILHYQNRRAQDLYEQVMAASNDQAYQEALKAYAREVSQNAASDWLYTRKSLVVASGKLHDYPVNMVDERLPLAAIRMD